MTAVQEIERWEAEAGAHFTAEASRLLEPLRRARTLETARRRLYRQVTTQQLEHFSQEAGGQEAHLQIARDCARTWRSLLHPRSDQLAGFSVCAALWDLARGRPRPELQPAFHAELTYLLRGIAGRGVRSPLDAPLTLLPTPQRGRAAARIRSAELDDLWSRVAHGLERFEDGLTPAAQARRALRRRRICEALQVTETEFMDWRWQIEHLARDEPSLQRLVRLSEAERSAIREARRARLPFGVTPYYASLLDDEPADSRDRALRAQVIPPLDYVERMASLEQRRTVADFMLERDTSPVDLITRRYPAIAILKPYNTCPQICVYCQRNWEIHEAMAPGAQASREKLDRALRYLADHPAIREVLVTGGDPLALPDDELLELLGRIAALPHIDLIRIGTRTPVTLPMRFTPELVAALGRLREPGRRELCLVTHVQHVYEVTPELVTAVDRLRRQGISVLNQHVFTFHVSRRFEAAALRLLLRRCGIEPYYTFLPKGKQETHQYRVPIARLLQEQKEEARLLPGSRRTDEAVYNVPGLGKNYLRAAQHRDLISLRPDGSRVYEFHPWEKGIVERESYVGEDVPILDYLERLARIGEDPADYESIWYYF